MDTGLLIGIVGIVVGIVGIVITTAIAVYSIRDANKQIKNLINLERNRIFVRIRNDMVWLFVNPTKLAHTAEIAKGLEEFNLMSAALQPEQTPNLTNDIVNNETLEYADKLVKVGYATWKPDLDRKKLKQALSGRQANGS